MGNCGCGSRDDFGKCHVCGKQKDIRYCGRCDHWFCKRCSKRWIFRAFGAVRQRLFGRRKNCCGPDA